MFRFQIIVNLECPDNTQYILVYFYYFALAKSVLKAGEKN